jgi:hypothetical protein
MGHNKKKIYESGIFKEINERKRARKPITYDISDIYIYI